MEKAVLITGATSGFGEACAKRFAAEGWNLILTGRRNERLEALKSQLIQSYNIQVLTLCFDVRNQNECQAALSSLSDDWKAAVEVLVNNAGLAAGKEPIDQGNIADWEQMLDTNVKGLLYVSQRVIPWFKAKQGGHIINISSIAGKEVYPEGNVYCASKHAVDALSKAMRIDLLPYGIKVSNIAPGAAETEFSTVRFKGNEEKVQATYQGFDPLVAEDIANCIYFVVNQPKHVTINDLIIMPTAQASSMHFNKTN